MEDAIAAYRARSSDQTMVRWVAPAIGVVMILIGVAFPGYATILFVGLGLFILGRWYWIARVLAFEIDLATSGDMSVRTRVRTVDTNVSRVRTLAPSGLRKRAKGPHRLMTDDGWFMLFPEGLGYTELTAAVQAQNPRFLVVGSGVRDGERPLAEYRFAPGATSDTRPGAGGGAGPAQPRGLPVTRGETPGPTANEGLAPGVTAVRIYGSASLADAGVKRLEEEGVIALVVPAPGGVGGVRLAVKEEDAARAASIIDG